MIHIKRIDEMQINEHHTSPVENKLYDYFADGCNGLHRNRIEWDDSEWVPMTADDGDYADAIDWLEEEGYTSVYDFSDGDAEIWEKDGVYYMMNLEEDPEGGWGSWIVDLTPVVNYVKQLL